MDKKISLSPGLQHFISSPCRSLLALSWRAAVGARGASRVLIAFSQPLASVNGSRMCVAGR